MTGEHVFKAGAVSLIGSSFAAVSALLVAVVVGRSLGTSGTGLFFQAVGIISILAAVLQLGTSSALVWGLVQRRALGRIGGESRIVMIALLPVIALSPLVAMIMYFAAEPIAAFLSHSNSADLAVLLRLLAWFVVPLAVLGVLQTVVRVQRGVLSFSLLQGVAVPASRLAGVVLAAIVGAGVTATVGWWIISTPLWLLITLACLVRPMLADLRARPEKAVPGDLTAGRFWRYSAARALGVAIEFGLNWVDVLIVAALRPPAEAGVYAVASRCVQAGAVVDQATRVAAGPTISWHLAREERVEASELHLSVTRVATLISWPFYVTLIVMGPAVLGLFGDGFDSGAFVVGLLAAVMMIVASTGMLQSILLMGGRSSWQVYNKAVALALSVVGNLLLVPILGIAGAALTSALVVAVDTAIATWLVHWRMGVHLAPLRLIRSGAVPLLVFGVGGGLLRWVLGTSTSDLFLWLAMLVPVYAVVVWILRDRLELVAIWHARHQGVDLQRVAQ